MTKIHGHLSSHNLTILEKELIAILAAMPTSLGGGNHGHTNTITPQPSQTPSHTAEIRVKNSSQVTNNTPKPRVETTITPQPIKNTIKHSRTKGGKLQSSDLQHPTTKGGNHREPRAKAGSQEPRYQEPRAKSQEPRAKSQELRAKS